MIDIKTLTEKDIGKWVRYQPRPRQEAAVEIGRIKSWNEKFIFVVYHCDDQWNKFHNYTGAATKPADLEFLEKSCQ